MSDKGHYSTPEDARLAAAKSLSADEERTESCHVASADAPEVGKEEVEAARVELESFFDELDGEA